MISFVVFAGSFSLGLTLSEFGFSTVGVGAGALVDTAAVDFGSTEIDGFLDKVAVALASVEIDGFLVKSVVVFGKVGMEGFLDKAVADGSVGIDGFLDITGA